MTNYGGVVMEEMNVWGGGYGNEEAMTNYDRVVLEGINAVGGYGTEPP
jgi:hypothetical protein